MRRKLWFINEWFYSVWTVAFWMRRIANATVHLVGMESLVNGLATILTKNVVLKLRAFRLIFVQYMEVDRFPKSFFHTQRSQKAGLPAERYVNRGDCRTTLNVTTSSRSCSIGSWNIHFGKVWRFIRSDMWNSFWKANKVYPPLIPPMICRETCGHCRLIEDQTEDELCCKGKMCFNEGFLNAETCDCICPFGGRSIDCKWGLKDRIS